MTLSIERFQTPQEFEFRVGESLRKHVVLNQMPLGVAQSAATEPDRYPIPIRMMAVIGRDGTVEAAAVQTPPHPVLVSLGQREAIRSLGEAFRASFADATQVWGPESSAIEFAIGFAGHAGSSLGASGAFELSSVAPTRSSPGRARVATSADSDLLQRWMTEFTLEALPNDTPPEPNRGSRLAHSGRCWIWEDEGGSPVCFANNSRQIAGYWSVGPVYTPKELRGRGYAMSLVSHWSAMALNSGATACTLFTDLANPTSNRLYERIGYVRVGTMLRLGFTRSP